MDVRDLSAFTITSASELLLHVEKLMGTPDFVFRGQTAEYDTLTTSIERHAATRDDLARYNKWTGQSEICHEADKFKYGYLNAHEEANLRDYQSRIKHFLSDLPATDDYCEWFALMQHHGAPTRLLDVTDSIFVALYFATEHANEHDGIVYSFFNPDVYSPPYTDSYKGTLLQKIVDECKTLEQRLQAKEIANRLISADGPNGSGCQGIRRFTSMRPSKREIAQQGSFLVPMTLQTSFEQNLFSMYERGVNAVGRDYKNDGKPTWDLDTGELSSYPFSEATEASCPIIKIRIPRAAFRNIRMALKHMNITAESLFPDFDGLTKSMHGRINWWKEVHGCRYV